MWDVCLGLESVLGVVSFDVHFKEVSLLLPSAQSAHPEYELSTVMTTGISAPPMEAVMWTPRAPDRAPAPPVGKKWIVEKI